MIELKDSICGEIALKIGEDLKQLKFDKDYFTDHISKCPVCKNSITELTKKFLTPGGGLNLISIMNLIKK